MKAFKKLFAVSAAAAILFSGCIPWEEETTPTDTLNTMEELNDYLSSSEDEAIAALDRYLAPTDIPEGMMLTRIEVQPERKFVTYYYNLGRYVATTEELAEELVADIDLSVFSFFPSTSSSKRYNAEKAARTVLKETDEYLFRWSYAGDGQALLEKGLEYYGDPVEMEGQTYYITEVTERMVVSNTPEGQGLDVIFYQVVWTQDDYLFFIKLPKEFAETMEEIPQYTRMAWETITETEPAGSGQ